MKFVAHMRQTKEPIVTGVYDQMLPKTLVAPPAGSFNKVVSPAVPRPSGSVVRVYGLEHKQPTAGQLEAWLAPVCSGAMTGPLELSRANHGEVTSVSTFRLQALPPEVMGLRLLPNAFHQLLHL